MGPIKALLVSGEGGVANGQDIVVPNGRPFDGNVVKIGWGWVRWTNDPCVRSPCGMVYH